VSTLTSSAPASGEALMASAIFSAIPFAERGSSPPPSEDDDAPEPAALPPAGRLFPTALNSTTPSFHSACSTSSSSAQKDAFESLSTGIGYLGGEGGARGRAPW
jgi:hypothetical protein